MHCIDGSISALVYWGDDAHDEGTKTISIEGEREMDETA